MKLGLLLPPLAVVLGAPQDPLTIDGLRDLLESSGMTAANTRLIHTQMQQQKAQLPPWWPEEVSAQEEQAMVQLQVAPVALPYYRACISEGDARVLAKVTRTKAGQTIAKSAAAAHEAAALGGAAPETAQAAGEQAANKAVPNVSPEAERHLADSLTSAEKSILQRDFTPAKVAAFRQCADQAFLQTSNDMKGKQEQAIQAIEEANKPKILQAERNWEATHPATQR